MLLLLVFQIFIMRIIAFNVNDDVLYEITWSDEPHITDADHDLLMSTTNNETYSCKLPTSAEKKNFKEVIEPGFDEISLLSPLFETSPCIYKFEGYWAYELCHGKHVRQYRSELVFSKTSQIIKEFYLGYFTASENVPIQNEFEKTGTKSIRINGRDFVYFEVEYYNGSVCDLTGGNRASHVLYICVEESNGELFQISEIESCVYQIVVFTKELCKSPKYNTPNAFRNSIQCRSHDDKTPIKPTNLDSFEKEKQELSADSPSNLENLFGFLNIKGFKVEKVKQDGVMLYRIRTVDTLENDQTDFIEELELQEPGEDKLKNLISSSIPPPAVVTPNELGIAQLRELQSFFNKETCLTGGVGWWRYEVCFGTRIFQFHENLETKERHEIVLGVWDEDIHRAWVAENPELKPIPDLEKRQKFSQYYSNGDFCEKINARRSVLMTIQCEPSLGSVVQLSYSEPKDCQYSISLGSALFCSVVKQADINGILQKDIRIY